MRVYTTYFHRLIIPVYYALSFVLVCMCVIPNVPLLSIYYVTLWLLTWVLKIMRKCFFYHYVVQIFTGKGLEYI